LITQVFLYFLINKGVTSKMSRVEKNHEKKEVKSINPLDSSVTDLELDKVIF
jgi:hypothetical protein